jgi:hypothetical protein
MIEQEHFQTIEVTFELRLYHGRLNEPFKKGENWLLYFKDQFSNTWANEGRLRPGEYIYVKDTKMISKN